MKLLVFRLDNVRYALRLEAVSRVERMVAVTPLPKAPDVILGIISLHGRVVPVIDIRERFRLPRKKAVPTDQMIIARTSRRTLAIPVDAVEGIVEANEGGWVEATTISRGVEYMDGVIQRAGDLILVQALEAFLAPGEHDDLDRALVATPETDMDRDGGPGWARGCSPE